MIKHIDDILITIDHMLIKSAKLQATFGITRAMSWLLVGNYALCAKCYYTTVH